MGHHNSKTKRKLVDKVFTQKEIITIRETRPRSTQKRLLSKTAREDLRNLLKDNTQLGETTKHNLIKKAFTIKELRNKCPEDMTDSNIEILLRKYQKADEETTNSSSEHENKPKRPTDNEQRVITELLSKYEEQDNESPDTETRSQVETEEMSGSEEEIIDYTNPAVNREDLPRVNFDYKN